MPTRPFIKLRRPSGPCKLNRILASLSRLRTSLWISARFDETVRGESVCNGLKTCLSYRGTQR